MTATFEPAQNLTPPAASDAPLHHQPPATSVEPLSLYAHIPFCKTRCSYCAFNTYTGLDALIPAFVDALCREIELVAKGAPETRTQAHTLYFGGGTPSLLEPGQVAQIIGACRSQFTLDADAEITLEVNPGTVDLARMQGFRAAGVNRISVGVQSAQPSDLELFGRKHSFEETVQAYQLARKAGFDNVSIDLIYGAPRQTRERWQDSLNTVLAWEPDHVSLYSLTLEPQTLLERQVTGGLIEPPDPDLAADMYEDSQDYMSRAGLAQYEISNWARPGREAKHNRQYWLNRPFLGFGPGAHGADAGKRYWNVKPVHEYIRRVNEGSVQAYPFSSVVADYEVIDETMAMAETVILGLRLVSEGLDGVAFERRFDRPLWEVYASQIEELTRLRLVARRDQRLYLTPRAYLISNRVCVAFYPD
jgi:oxygen-independent coproporphyrinogen-3 oxidase